MFVHKVLISRLALKQLSKMPVYITDKLNQWVERVEFIGLDEVRKIKGLHDEPLHGTRKGQRSIRLNKGYRAIYYVNEADDIVIVNVIEVSNHEY